MEKFPNKVIKFGIFENGIGGKITQKPTNLTLILEEGINFQNKKEEYPNYLIKEKLKFLDSVVKYYFDEYNFNSIKSYLSQSSLFGDTNFLIIKRDKKIPKQELETLIA